MVIKNGMVNFKFKMVNDMEWQDFNQPLSFFKKNNFTDAETLSMEIHELIYAMDDRAYQDKESLELSVNDFWDDIVLPCHEALYGKNDQEDFI